MTMTELILNALDNFVKANRNRHQARAGSAEAANKAEAIAEKLRLHDMLKYAELKELAEMQNVAPGTSNAITQIYNMLHGFAEAAKAQQKRAIEKNQNALWPLTQITDDDPVVFSQDDLERLPAIKNWHRVDEWSKIRKDTLRPDEASQNAYSQVQTAVFEQIARAVDDNMAKLEAADQSVWNGSHQYDDLMQSMRDLQRMKNKDGQLNPVGLQADVNKKYAEVLQRAQAYLQYKAGDQRSINEKGRIRIKVVNELVNQLTALQQEGIQNNTFRVKRVNANSRVVERIVHQEREQAQAQEQQRAEEKRLKEEQEHKKSIEQEKERKFKDLIDEQNKKNRNAVKGNPQLAVNALSYLRERENAVNDKYYNEWQKLDTYQWTSGDKDFKRVEGFKLDKKEYDRICKMAELSLHLMHERKVDIAPTEERLNDTLACLYEIYIAPDYLMKDSPRTQLLQINGYTENAAENLLYHELGNTNAFKNYRAKVLSEGGSAEYQKLLKDPQTIKDLVKSGVAELLAQDKELNELKEKLPYLKDYKNVLYDEYRQLGGRLKAFIKRTKTLEALQGRTCTDSEILRDKFGLSDKQYEKIQALSGDRGYQANYYYTIDLSRGDGCLKDYNTKDVVSTLYDIYYHPAFGEPGNEEPLPDKLGSPERKEYLLNLDGLKELNKLDRYKLQALIRNKDAIAKEMKKLHDEVEKSGVLSEETMENERKALKTSVNYLLNYKNSIYPKYVEERRKLDAYLNKADALNRRKKELEKLGLNEAQDKKIKHLSGDVMKKFREHMSMDDKAIHNAASEELINKTLDILCLTYFNQSFNQPGNISKVPETAKKMRQAAEEMGKQFRETAQMKAWVQSPAFKEYWNLNLEKGRKSLLMLHGNMKYQMGFMELINEIGVANSLIPTANSAALLNNQNNVNPKRRNSVKVKSNVK